MFSMKSLWIRLFGWIFDLLRFYESGRNWSDFHHFQWFNSRIINFMRAFNNTWIGSISNWFPTEFCIFDAPLTSSWNDIALNVTAKVCLVSFSYFNILRSMHMRVSLYKEHRMALLRVLRKGEFVGIVCGDSVWVCVLSLLRHRLLCPVSTFE